MEPNPSASGGDLSCSEFNLAKQVLVSNIYLNNMKVLIVIPVFNEAAIIGQNLLKLFEFCKKNFNEGRVDWQIVAADNKSTDKSGEVIKKLASGLPKIIYLYVPQKGKGIVIRTAWQKYPADIYCFMDADLATDLEALPKLISAISQEDYDLAVGSRFLKESKVKRSLLRRFTSFGYHLVLKALLGLKVKDTPCGFKAISNSAKEKLLPQVKNNEWFFDSELVILAEKGGYKIKEIPVKWVEGEKSEVKTFKLSWSYFKEVLKLKSRLKSGSAAILRN